MWCLSASAFATIDVYMRGGGQWDTQNSTENARTLFILPNYYYTSWSCYQKNSRFRRRSSRFNQQMSKATHVPNGCHTRRWPGKWYLFPQKSLPMCVALNHPVHSTNEYGLSHHNEMKQIPSPTSCTVNSLTTTNSAKIVSHLLSPYPTHIPPHAILPVLHISLHCLAQWQESPHQCKYDVKNTGQQPTLLSLMVSAKRT